MERTAKSRSKTRIQREKTEEILSAALDVFSKFGLRGTSINLISETAGMSTPSILYYFKNKEDIHKELLNRTVLLWLGPLHLMKENPDPITEISDYVRRKLAISKDFPRESRLFANEILMGVPSAHALIFEPLRTVFNAKVGLIEHWIKEGKIVQVDAHHLLYSIWATTQHYADFESQINELSPEKIPNLFVDAEKLLIPMYEGLLRPKS